MGIREPLKPKRHRPRCAAPWCLSQDPPRTHRGNELFLRRPPHPPTSIPTFFSCLRPSPSILLLRPPPRPLPPPPSTPVDLAQFSLPSAQFWSSWSKIRTLIRRLDHVAKSRVGHAPSEQLFEEWGTKLFLCCWQKLRHFSGRPVLKWQVKLRSRESVRCCNIRGAPAEVIELVRRLMAPKAVLVWKIGMCEMWSYFSCEENNPVYNKNVFPSNRNL